MLAKKKGVTNIAFLSSKFVITKVDENLQHRNRPDWYITELWKLISGIVLLSMHDHVFVMTLLIGSHQNIKKQDINKT